MSEVDHHARITGKDIVDKTVLEADIGAHAIGFGELTAGLQGSLGGIANSVGSTQLKKPAVGSAQLYNASVNEYKLAEHYEHGTITGVTLTGRYKAFSTPFGATPHVVLTPIGTYDASLALAPAVGSFKAKISTNAGLSGTANIHFHAWGNR